VAMAMLPLNVCGDCAACCATAADEVATAAVTAEARRRVFI
jgi:hypothetical protein